METFGSVVRLVSSQLFFVTFIILLIPLKAPVKRSVIYVIIAALIIVSFNALLIINLGLESFYLRFHFLTLILPYFIIYSLLAVHKGGKLIFALLTVQIFGNLAIINGLFVSYLMFEQDHPVVDAFVRGVTLLLILPFFIYYIKPTYDKMLGHIKKGWTILNLSLIMSYLVAYFILFVPTVIFERPNYFIHAYLLMALALLLYAIMFYLFKEISLKAAFEQDKNRLSFEVSTLSEASKKITSIAFKDALTNIKNRYSLFIDMEHYIAKKQPFLVVFMDLNQLKSVNDTYGHVKGDYYIKAFTLSLQITLDNKGDVYRYAGDEFICLIKNGYENFNVEGFKEQLSNNIHLDIPYQGVSIGVAQYPMDGLNAGDLISLSDQAMYKEKKIFKH